MKKILLSFSLIAMFLMTTACLDSSTEDLISTLVSDWSLVGQEVDGKIATGSSLKFLAIRSTVGNPSTTAGSFNVGDISVMTSIVPTFTASTSISFLEVPNNISSLISSLNDNDYYSFIVLDDTTSNNSIDSGERAALAVPLNKASYSSSNLPDITTVSLFVLGSELKSNSYVLILSDMQVQ